MSLTKLLIKENRSIEDIVDHVAVLIEKHLSINLDDITDKYELLGSGNYARVYNINKYPDKVLRIENELYNNYASIVAEHDDLDHVVKVYYYKIIEIPQFDHQEVEISVLEKLEPLGKYEQQELDYIDNYYGLYPKDLPEPELLEISAEFSDVLHIIKDIHKGLKELEDIGIYYNDLHSGNVMYDSKTEKYKLIDLSNL